MEKFKILFYFVLFVNFVVLFLLFFFVVGVRKCVGIWAGSK